MSDGKALLHMEDHKSHWQEIEERRILRDFGYWFLKIALLVLMGLSLGWLLRGEW